MCLHPVHSKAGLRMPSNACNSISLCIYAIMGGWLGEGKANWGIISNLKTAWKICIKWISSICRMVCLSTYLPTHPPIHPSIHPSVHLSSTCFCFYRPLYVTYIDMYIYTRIYIYTHIYIYIYIHRCIYANIISQWTTHPTSLYNWPCWKMEAAKDQFLDVPKTPRNPFQEDLFVSRSWPNSSSTFWDSCKIVIKDDLRISIPLTFQKISLQGPLRISCKWPRNTPTTCHTKRIQEVHSSKDRARRREGITATKVA